MLQGAWLAIANLSHRMRANEWKLPMQLIRIKCSSLCYCATSTTPYAGPFQNFKFQKSCVRALSLLPVGSMYVGCRAPGGVWRASRHSFKVSKFQNSKFLKSLRRTHTNSYVCRPLRRFTYTKLCTDTHTHRRSGSERPICKPL